MTFSLRARKLAAAFSLIELLVVISIIALLIGILLPALSHARQAAKAGSCLSNVRQLVTAVVAYGADNKDLAIPSYNMTGYGGTDTTMDGWGPILDRDGYVPGSREIAEAVFTCPETVDRAGMESGQTNNLDDPKGWMEWPNIRSAGGTGNTPTTLPDQHFLRIIKVSYWINGDNPVGSLTAVTQTRYATKSVGYEGSNDVMKATPLSAYHRPSSLVFIADGVYSGRQNRSRLGTDKCRIGYRHAGGVGTANTGFADGHGEPIQGDQFPTGDATLDANIGSLTVFAQP